jgi:hypothetical protein
MKKLQFAANCEHHQANQEDSAVAQKQVADLLASKLGQYGFEVLPQGDDRVAVSVDNHQLPLSVTCQGHNAEGHLVCEITSYPDEEQDWLERITEQSLLNQLAQAVENSLKEDDAFSQFSWKG